MLLSTLTNTNTTHSFCLMHYKKKKRTAQSIPASGDLMTVKSNTCC